MPQIESQPSHEASEQEQNEIVITKEMLGGLDDEEEAPQYYRGMDVHDAFLALFGKLKLEGKSDNVTSSLQDAIMYAPTARDKNGEEFLCAAGVDLLQGAKIKNSHIGRQTQFIADGFAFAQDIIIRKKGKEAGNPGKVIYMSPKQFLEWYNKNINIKKIEV